MKKPKQLLPSAEVGDRTAAGTTPSPTDSTPEITPSLSTPQAGQEMNGSETTPAPGARKSAPALFLSDGTQADEKLRALTDKLLTEGSTFEDVVEAVKESSKSGVTLNALQRYFQGYPELQAKRMHYLVETAESLLKGLGDPKSAEERLAKAAYLEAYLKLHRDAAPVELKDAEHARMERVTVELKHKLVVVQRDKARQALNYSREKTRILVLTQEKLREEILKLQQAASRQKAGEPMGPAMLQKIQQLYGLACQPQPYGGLGNAAKA